jgi:hypothetical protein
LFSQKAAPTGSPAPPRLSNLLKEKEFWILVLLTILFFHRQLFLGETFYFRDLLQHFIPQKRLVMSVLQDGALPLWDPFRQGGQPGLANPNTVALYPTNLLYTVLSLWVAFNLDIVLHFMLCGAGTYVLARILGFPPRAAMISGLAFQFCGYTLSLGNFLSRLYAAPSTTTIS